MSVDDSGVSLLEFNCRTALTGLVLFNVRKFGSLVKVEVRACGPLRKVRSRRLASLHEVPGPFVLPRIHCVFIWGGQKARTSLAVRLRGFMESSAYLYKPALWGSSKRAAGVEVRAARRGIGPLGKPVRSEVDFFKKGTNRVAYEGSSPFFEHLIGKLRSKQWISDSERVSFWCSGGGFMKIRAGGGYKAIGNARTSEGVQVARGWQTLFLADYQFSSRLR